MIEKAVIQCIKTSDLKNHFYICTAQGYVLEKRVEKIGWAVLKDVKLYPELTTSGFFKWEGNILTRIAIAGPITPVIHDFKYEHIGHGTWTKLTTQEKYELSQGRFWNLPWNEKKTQLNLW